MMPQQQFGGAYLHEGLAAMDAAYLYHLVRNHPFLDGNKRTGFLLAALFLEINGQTFAASEESVVLHTLRLAAGEETEADYARWLGEVSSPA